MIYYNSENFTVSRNTAVTIGNFDGLHKGHMKLMEMTAGFKAQGLLAAVLSFSPHPLKVIRGFDVKNIFTSEEKREILAEHVDCFVEYPFTEKFAAYSPEEFIGEVLAKKLKAKAVIIGEGYCFGKNKSGDIAAFKEYEEKYGYKVYAVKHCMQSLEKISSTAIRSFIAEGNIESANILMGRNYFIRRNIDARQEISFEPDENKLLPAEGAYEAEVVVNGVIFQASVYVAGREVTVNSPGIDESGQNIKIIFRRRK